MATACASTGLIPGSLRESLHLNEIEVPTVEQCVREDAIETQHIHELGLGRAWFVNDLRAFLPAWQDMELASPYPEEPVTQIEADVPVKRSPAGRSLQKSVNMKEACVGPP